jgi:hypothetical protein
VELHLGYTALLTESKKELPGIAQILKDAFVLSETTLSILVKFCPTLTPKLTCSCPKLAYEINKNEKRIYFFIK